MAILFDGWEIRGGRVSDWVGLGGNLSLELVLFGPEVGPLSEVGRKGAYDRVMAA